MKNTWRHWLRDSYYEFKSFKVYWAYRLSIRDQLELEQQTRFRPGIAGGFIPGL